ncbi:MAG TPA: aminotransferase class I/II-fold pyridoxal phosphate-dependent enzyme [Flavitalea sp.]|nr:aminotransferase class I/II-fold pyridoxal phosphate-dependent enzyme [Flavitalea sp.]
MKPKIWLSSPHMGELELEYVKEAFATNWIAPLGPNVDAFEKDLETFLGNGSHVAALSSGTAAIHLALVILGVKAGDEVICQSMTFSASANPIAYQGATPVFVDSEESTWNMSPEFLETAILDRIRLGQKPKAIIVVHLYGMPAQIDKIRNIADVYQIPLVEDAAEALGSSYSGQQLGTFGDLGILSFNGNKIITTSGGGALVSKNNEYIRKARFLSTQALDPAPHYQHSHIGFNYRMSNVCAGIGRGQMKVLPERIEKRRSSFKFYKSTFANISSIRLLEEPDASYFSNHWLSTMIIEDGPVSREDIRLSLVAENIDSRPLWKPMHLQPVFESYPHYGNGTSDLFFKNGLCLPSGSNLLEDDLERVAAAVKNAFSRNAAAKVLS